jgi:hypothetical protein
MHPCTHRRNSLISLMVVATMFLFTCDPCDAQETETTRMSPEWQSTFEKGNSALQRAQECLGKPNDSATCNADALKEATGYFDQLVALCRKLRCDAKALAVPVDGLVSAGRGDKAQQAILGFAQWEAYPELVHRLADIRFASGDYTNAAMLYSRWIAGGCQGYMYLPDDLGLWLAPKNKDQCASLPVPLRTRLEYLQEMKNGMLANLPTVNEAPVRFHTK